MESYRLNELVKNKSNVIIVHTTEYSYLIPNIQSEIENLNQNCNVFIILQKDLICSQKITAQYDSIIIIGSLCPLHSDFKNSYIFKFELPIQNTSILFDGRRKLFIDKIFRTENTFSNEIQCTNNINLDKKNLENDDILIVSHNQKIFDYFFYEHSSCDPYFTEKITKKDKCRFLISRWSRIEKIKEKNVFGIFFASKEYTDLANEVKRFLLKKEKRVFLFFLKDISSERLTAIDGLECAVIIDCPLFINFDIQCLIPVVTPYEITLAYEEHWDGRYFINRFEVSEQLCESEIVKYFDPVNVIVRSDFKGLEYDGEDVNEIEEGRKGIPREYNLDYEF
ncbi:putative diphthamide synthesis protein [Hamiltosporidium magnivora]|uniref:Putative diphthamide synthesis protein n=1 Tax=Hamiltosporidium magnivora TaxID=148818 RepID=A0A4Q9L531_9MICR|nr:putative diphthamide synthesis protein [Hamiltosporidium magnivora]